MRVVKWSGVMLALIVIVGFVTPYFMGFIVQKDFQNYVKLSKQVQNNMIKLFHMDAVYKMQLKNYHRGWFDSTADLHIVGNVPVVYGHHRYLREVAINYKVLIEHGPWFKVQRDGYTTWRFGRGLALLTLQLNPRVNAMFETFTGKPLKIYQDIFMGFAGGYQIHFSFPKIRFYLNLFTAKLNLDWQGMSVNTSMSHAGTHFHSLVNVLPLKLQVTAKMPHKTVQNINVDLQGISATVAKQSINKPFDGADVVLRVPQALYSDNHYHFSLNSLLLAIHQKISATTLAWLGQLSLKNMTYNNKQQFGPGKITIQVKNVPKTFIDKQLSLFIRGQNLTPAQQALQQRRQLEALFKPGLTLMLKAKDLHLLNGNLSVAMGLTVEKPIVAKPSEISHAQPWEKGMLNAFKFKCNITITQSLVKALTALTHRQQKVRQQLKTWLAKGYLKKQQDNYSTTVEYHSGILTINGHATPVALPAAT